MKKPLLLTLLTILTLVNFTVYSQSGFTCNNAIAIPTLPYITTDNTANYGDTYDIQQPTSLGISGNYMSGNDVFYSYTPTSNETINIKMTPTATWSGIFVYDGCSNVGLNCIAGVGNSNSTMREISDLNVLAGHTYIIAISTYAPPQTTIYTLNVQTVSCPKPTNLIVSNTSFPSTTIGWTENGTANQWEIAVLPSGTTITPNTTGTIVNTNPATITNLTSASNSIYVRSICSPTATSNWSANAEVVINSCVVPGSLTVNNITTNSSNLSWTNNSNVTTWQIAVQPSLITTLPTTGVSISNVQNYLASNLNPGTSYKAYIRTDCGNGLFSSWTSPITFTTLAPALTTPTCGGNFIDNGGLNANYYNSTDSTITIYPTTPGEVVTVTFTSFDTESNWDGLYVYNGNSTLATLISSGNPAASVPGGLAGAYWGTTIPGPFTSTSADGSLTFRFRSDTAVNRPGWNANVTCGAPQSCPAPINILTSNLAQTSANFTWTETGSATQWEVLVLPASSNAPNSGSTGTIVSTPSFSASNLTNGTLYKIYVRAICSSNNASLWSNISFTTLTCSSPAFSISSITNNSCIINKTSALQLPWEILVLNANATAPTATSNGIVLSTSSYNALNLICNTNYKVYTRAACSQGTVSNWSTGTSFTTSACQLTTGQPTNMFQCSDSGLNCFNLTDNNSTILGNLNPTEYTISYYSTSTNATAQTNALASPYCLTNSSQTIYALLSQNSTGLTQILTFTISSQSINSTIALNNLDQCDTDFDGSVIFNLSSQVISVNTVSYYTSLVNAQSQSNPITNPSTYSIPSSSPNVTIFARELIVGACDNMYSFQLHAYSNCNLAYNCNQANSLCGSLGVPFANTHQAISAETGNNYGCLNSTPNPTWFYLPVSNAGTINLTVQQSSNIAFNGGSLDVDYVVYGPFTNPVAPCSAGLTQTNIISCSYSAAAIEFPTIPNAQVGQYYLLMTTNFSNQAGFIQITMNTTSTGSIDCSGMRLNAFLDNNNNGTQDTGEQNFPLGQFHYEINDSGNVHNVVSPTGIYNIYDLNATNSYDLSYTIDNMYSSMYSISTSAYNNVNVVIGGGMVTYNFPITITQAYNDLAVAIIPSTSPRAGLNHQNKIVYANLGNQLVPSGTVTFNHDSVNTIVSISQSGTTSVANGFTYNFSNLLPFEVRTITVTLHTPPIPTVAIGQLLTNTANVTPTTGETIILNNSASLTQSIIASYDPNDKTESHGEQILFSSFASNDYLTYTIRFENTGTAEALNVRVTDVLDSKIDETSVQMIGSSHNYTMDRVSNNLTWNFENIQLPPSIADTEIGKGYITFKARLKPGFAIGDIIPNTASIFFDANPAIVTNTFNTQFVSTLSNRSFNENQFVMFPNPSSTSIQISSTNNTIESITLFDVLGKITKQIKGISSNQSTIDVSNLSKGMYIVEIVTENGLKENKKLIID